MAEEVPPRNRSWLAVGVSRYWVFDAFFVPPAIWEMVFKPFGIECRPVVNTKGVELRTVVQEEVDIVTDDLKPLPCPDCQRIHYA